MPLKMHWFVFYVQGRKEHSLCNELNRYEGIKAFVPMMERIQKKEGCRKIILKEMFPGYIFLKTNKEQSYIESIFRESKSKISGFKKFLKYDNFGTNPLTNEEVYFLELILNSNYILNISKGNIVNGKLLIHEGPLLGMEQNIKWLDRHKCIAKLYIEILGKEVLAGLEVKLKED